MESRRQDVDGISMRWAEADGGDPVVFLHGLPTSPTLWRHVVPQMEPARCLAWELVGYGLSIPEGEQRPIGIAAQAEYLRSWLDHLDLDRVVLVGHDAGGGVAQVLAVRHPERVRALVLVSSIYPDNRAAKPVRWARHLGPLLKRAPEAALRRVVFHYIRRGHDTEANAEAALEEHWPPYRAVQPGPALARQANALVESDTEGIGERLPGLHVPARLLWGTADPFQKISAGYRLANTLKAPIERVEGGRHFLPEDHPTRVANMLKRLLAELSRR